MKKLFALLLTIFSSVAFSVDRSSCESFALPISSGINYGNLFEKSKYTKRNYITLKKDLLKIKNFGFDFIRLPVKWDEKYKDGAIDVNFMTDVIDFVDYAREIGLFVIINQHHYNDFYSDPYKHGDNFLDIWRIISDKFKNYKNVMYETINEPKDKLQKITLNYFQDLAVKEIRKNSKDSIIVFSPGGYAKVDGLVGLDVPVDCKVVLGVHYYAPGRFTHQGSKWIPGSDSWLGEAWPSVVHGNKDIESDFVLIEDFAKKNRLDVLIGEFGVTNKADPYSRERWVSAVVDNIRKNGWSFSYWDYDGDFGFVRRSGNDIIAVDEIDFAIFKNVGRTIDSRSMSR